MSKSCKTCTIWNTNWRASNDIQITAPRQKQICTQVTHFSKPRLVYIMFQLHGCLKTHSFSKIKMALFSIFPFFKLAFTASNCFFFFLEFKKKLKLIHKSSHCWSKAAHVHFYIHIRKSTVPHGWFRKIISFFHSDILISRNSKQANV